MTLNELKVGQSGTVKKIDADPVLKRAIVSNGITKGSTVTVTNVAPMGSPIVVKVRTMTITLRKEEAAAITVE